ncbi:MAG: lysylphosphatidylglycerol synthase domain-containing protein [Bradymonadia bacterium]
MSKRSLWRLSIALILSTLLLTALLNLGNPVEIAESLGSLSLSSFAYWLGLYAVLIVMRGERLKVLLPTCRRPTLIRAIGVQGGLNRIIPFRLGEFTLPFLIQQREKVPTSVVVYSLVWIRIIEFALVMTGFIIGLVLYLQPQFAGLTSSVIVGASCVGLWGFALIDPSQFAKRLARLPTPRMIGSPRLKNGLTSFMEGLSTVPELSLFDRIKLMTWSLVVHGCILYLYFDLMDALGVTVSIPVLLVGVAASQLASSLPMLTIGSIGLHELGWVGGFTFGGLALDIAVTSGVLSQVITLLLGVLFVGLLYRWRS